MKASSRTFVLACLLIYGGIVNADILDVPGTTDKFLCDNRILIPMQFTCDGLNDCEDASDEAVDYCGFTCNTGIECGGQCLMENQVCDKQVDCPGGEDEEPSTCEFCSDGFICLDDSLRCVERDYVCDRYSDCDDGSDEDKQKCADKDTSYFGISATKKTETASSASTIIVEKSTAQASTTISSFLSSSLPTENLVSNTAMSPQHYTTTIAAVPLIPTSVPASLLKKCKRKPTHKDCSTSALTFIATHHLSKKSIQQCVKKPSKSKCKKIEVLLELRRKMTPLDFIPTKCTKKPRSKKCRKFAPLLGTSSSKKDKKSKEKGHKKSGLKKRKNKHTADKFIRKAKVKKT